MRLLLIPLALGQSLVLAQLLTPSEETQETVTSQADNNPIAGDNLEVGGVTVHQVLAERSDDQKVEESLPGIGTALKVNLTPSFRNGGIIAQESLSSVSSVNDNQLRSELLGSEHPANQPEYFTVAEYSQPLSPDAQFPRTVGLTQILGREQVLTRGGEFDPSQDLTQAFANPQSDYLTAVEYLQPQVMTTMAYQMMIIKMVMTVMAKAVE